MATAALALGLPALVGYLDAKYHLASDLHLISCLVFCKVQAAMREKRDRVNAFYVLEEHAQKFPERSYIWFEGRDYSFGEVFEMAKRYGNWLRDEYGVKKGDVVAIDFMNSPQMAFVWMGLWSIGANPAFYNYNLSGDALVHVVKVSTAKLAIVGQNVEENIGVKKQINEALPEVKVVILDRSLEDRIGRWRADRPGDELRSGALQTEMACLIYTSGTTGLPKPAIVTWWKVTLASKFVGMWLRMKPGVDRYYTSMPMYHASAGMFNVMTCLQVGATSCLGEKFSTKAFWSDVRASDATMIQYVGETCRYLLAAPPSPDDKNHKVTKAFGNGLRGDIWKQFRERFGIQTIGEFYGATESVSATWNLNTGDWGVGSIGVQGTLLNLMTRGATAVVDLDYETEEIWRDPVTGFCKKVPNGERGELIFKLDEKNIGATYKGYYRNEKASNSKLMKDVFKKGDVWFRSGDVLTFTDDGLIYFNDRIGDTYRWKSENISTMEVSNAINSHPRQIVQDSVVFGVPLPKHDGNAGVAAVVLSPDVSEDQATFDDLLKFLQGSLPKYAVPLFIRVIGEVERTGNNKIVKGGLRKQGVDPEKTSGPGGVWWLKDGRYQRFTDGDWSGISAGRVKL
ncbi:hypothetical protein H072_3957 [Dactylellina haptotyla CBS 200.50]|uniref:Very long-chain fatty acid transport protein n=1 Tax=Dactylellina haptotyla (strain CBS 200.50) TaxID=1284197 RepID=S8AGN5_DACHA|nr:hypothetical protein H072_3957 [Dactylellina haptotyla CBS 200.50]